MGTKQVLTGAGPDSRNADETGSPASLLDVCDRLADTLRTAEALLANRRRIDLAGLDTHIRQLCAGTLRLPPEEAGLLRAPLLRLLRQADNLHAALATERAEAERARPQ